MKIPVYNKNKKLLYTLDDTKEIARGGEGFLIMIPGNKNLVAKIYLPNCLNITEVKFLYLNKLNDKFFIKPHELLYDKNGVNIVGITMQYLAQDYYPLDVIFNKNYCLKNGIDLQKKEHISNQLLEAVKSAHNISIDIGDLSGLNIMINNNGDVKFIDVDSYQVPGIKHSNKLLEEIRDYFHGGIISKESDYFSLSVVIFNYLTHLHPFKGIHKKYTTLAERMIKKTPVFISDPNLIIPKCYEQISDKFLIDQYKRLYLNGERFLLSINKLNIPVVGKTTFQQNISEKEVLVQYISTNQLIEYAYFNDTMGMIRTKTEFIFYDVSNQGMILKRCVFLRKEWKDIFIGEKNVVGTKNNLLYKINIINGQSELIENVQLNPKGQFIHMNNFLLMIEEDFMWQYNLDEINYKNILINKSNIYTPGFKVHTGVVQTIGGLNYFYNNINKKINILQLPLLIRGYISLKDVGIIKYEENKVIKYKFFNIIDSTLNLFEETSELHHFAYRGKNCKDSLLFISDDNKINVFRALDFSKLAEINCSIISSTTRLFNTNSGIIALNENEAYLINKK